MALLTLDQCRAQCRVDGDYDDAELTALLVLAEAAVAAHLNRHVYADTATWDAALDGLADTVGQAETTYQAALREAEKESDPTRAQALRDVAQARRQRAAVWVDRTLHGLVADGGVLAAVRLTLGHLYAHRESVVSGEAVAELPLGVNALLRPLRRVMMP